jgi:hypothetical protein
MAKKIGINGVVRDMTPEEETKFLETEKEMIAFSEKMRKQREDHIALKASAKAKLIAGEALTEDEANTVVI